ncbi:hypothetical protein ACJIZ3_021817 [Penstemon smallii]|uniref:Uncharacterized protein n=1 Tax=Penstemon smallii TaxID=265156 RepID=A0ABD3SMR0_9LAMI
MNTLKKLLLVTVLNLNLHVITSASNDNERKPYIVYMGEVREDIISLTNVHNNLLSEAIGDETLARTSKLHSYGRSINGFAARLLPRESKTIIAYKKGVISVFPNKVQRLLTTRSWDFLGFPEKVKRNNQIESNIIVALLDTGVWVESPSFNDDGFGPPPSKWKGKCATDGNFSACNNKVIGAQYFNLDSIEVPNENTPPVVDVDGHGTHTASTAAGISVKGASLYGIAEGTARGGVPSARIASYKVCWNVGCQDMDTLAGFDAAIADGVDIISVSLGGQPRSFFEDPIAIGSFHALKKGILTVCAAGNDGPYLGTVSNVAPWIFTVAASTTDRKFETDVKLGNGEKISGAAINTFTLKKEMYPLTNGEQAQNFSGDSYGNISACDYGTLSKNKVKGKIVYCLGKGGDSTINELGGAGTIMSMEYFEDVAFPTLTPGTYISVQDGLKIDNYINSTKSAQAVIYKSRTVNNINAPSVASFSSRGPQQLSPHILKPDITAPGANILAAYTKYSTLTGDVGDKRVVNYNVESGTSMACPHVSGAAAYVKSFHPNWSPAAIKSALMTTSNSMKIKAVGAELASGSGEINPIKALHPGLVYDITNDNYISLLCKQGYNITDFIRLIGSKKKNCSDFPLARGADGLNYPSIHMHLKDQESDISAAFYRTLTNVGIGKSVYKARVKTPKGLSITVVPNILRFDKPYQKKSFKVILKGKFVREKSWYLSGSFVWGDSKHIVKTPVLVYRPSI